MDGTHKHAMDAPRWFILPCLVHIALLLIYLPSLGFHRWAGVYLSCLVFALPWSFCMCGCADAAFCHFSICVSICTYCMSASAPVCVSSTVFDMTRGDLPSVFSNLLLSCHVEPRTLLSWWQRWLTASVQPGDRFVWSRFLYYLGRFPPVVCRRKLHVVLHFPWLCLTFALTEWVDRASSTSSPCGLLVQNDAKHVERLPF